MQRGLIIFFFFTLFLFWILTSRFQRQTVTGILTSLFAYQWWLSQWSGWEKQRNRSHVMLTMTSPVPPWEGTVSGGSHTWNASLSRQLAQVRSSSQHGQLFSWKKTNLNDESYNFRRWTKQTWVPWNRQLDWDMNELWELCNVLVNLNGPEKHKIYYISWAIHFQK